MASLSSLRNLDLAPKGRNKPAQGIALGSRVQTILKPCKGGTIGEPRATLKSLAEIPVHAVRTACFARSGRHPLWLTWYPRALPWADLFWPFRARTKTFKFKEPRALPWADLFCPFRARTKTRSFKMSGWYVGADRYLGTGWKQLPPIHVERAAERHKHRSDAERRNEGFLRGRVDTEIGKLIPACSLSGIPRDTECLLLTL